MRSTRVRALAALVFAAIIFVAAIPQKPSNPDTVAEAPRLNNLGNAYMNQQLFEKALKALHDAAALDPKMTIAKMNEGIALSNLQKVDEAKSLLQDVTKADPR